MTTEIKRGDTVLVTRRGREDPSWVNSTDSTIGEVRVVTSEYDDIPLLDNGYHYHTSSLRPFPMLKVGDLVLVARTMPEWDVGPWVPEMNDWVGRVCKVTDVQPLWVRLMVHDNEDEDEDEDDDGDEYAFPRQVLSPLGFGIEPGAKVVVARRVDDWSGGWCDAMDQYIGSTFEVERSVDPRYHGEGVFTLVGVDSWIFPSSALALDIGREGRDNTINGVAMKIAEERGYVWDDLTSSQKKVYRKAAREKLGRTG